MAMLMTKMDICAGNDKFHFNYVMDSAWQLTSQFIINSEINCQSLAPSNISIVDIAKYGDSQVLTAADKRILHLMR